MRCFNPECACPNHDEQPLTFAEWRKLYLGDLRERTDAFVSAEAGTDKEDDGTQLLMEWLDKSCQMR